MMTLGMDPHRPPNPTPNRGVPDVTFGGFLKISQKVDFLSKTTSLSTAVEREGFWTKKVTFFEELQGPVFEVGHSIGMTTEKHICKMQMQMCLAA